MTSTISKTQATARHSSSGRSLPAARLLGQLDLIGVVSRLSQAADKIREASQASSARRRIRPRRRSGRRPGRFRRSRRATRRRPCRRAATCTRPCARKPVGQVAGDLVHERQIKPMNGPVSPGIVGRESQTTGSGPRPLFRSTRIGKPPGAVASTRASGVGHDPGDLAEPQASAGLRAAGRRRERGSDGPWPSRRTGTGPISAGSPIRPGKTFCSTSAA